MMLRPISVLVTTLALVGPASAANWTAVPAANQFGPARESLRYTLNPGGRLDDAVVVANSGAASLRVALRAAPRWVHVARSVTVGPGESLEVPVSVTLPSDAKPGDYVGEVAGVPLRLRVGGALRPSLAVENVKLDDDRVTYTIHNTGNAILRARVAVSGSAKEVGDLLPGERRRGSAPLPDATPVLRRSATVSVTPLLTDAAGSTAPLAVVRASGHAWVSPWVPVAGLFSLIVGGLAVRRLRPHRVPAVKSR